MSVRNCSPRAPARAPARTTAAKPIDFMVFIRFFQFDNPIWPLITRSGQKVHFLWEFARSGKKCANQGIPMAGRVVLSPPAERKINPKNLVLTSGLNPIFGRELSGTVRIPRLLLRKPELFHGHLTLAATFETGC